MVLRVERFQHQHEAGRLAQIHARPQVLDDVGGLVLPRQALVEAPGHDERLLTPVRCIVAMPSRIFCSSIARTSLSRVTKFLLLKSASSTNGPSFMFRFWISRTMTSWSAIGRVMRPLSNIAVKPSSAANCTWAARSVPAWALNWPRLGRS